MTACISTAALAGSLLPQLPLRGQRPARRLMRRPVGGLAGHTVIAHRVATSTLKAARRRLAARAAHYRAPQVLTRPQRQRTRTQQRGVRWQRWRQQLRTILRRQLRRQQRRQRGSRACTLQPCSQCSQYNFLLSRLLLVCRRRKPQRPQGRHPGGGLRPGGRCQLCDSLRCRCGFQHAGNAAPERGCGGTAVRPQQGQAGEQL